MCRPACGEAGGGEVHLPRREHPAAGGHPLQAVPQQPGGHHGRKRRGQDNPPARDGRGARARQ
eukprot:scaffold435773_cov46-Prasinocladus_malaysianus.AAC.1